MKKLFVTFLLSLSIGITMAQVPDIMNYQAVARNNAGAALANQTIKVRLTVNKNAVSQYSETRQVTTNALGLFNVQIGSAGALSTTGNFSGINWQNNAAPGYALKVELDINNSGTFTDMGSQTLVTVPYSFASKRADQATETVNLAGRPLNTTDVPALGSKLMWDGTAWSPVRDTIIDYAASAGSVINEGGGAAPWLFTGGEKTISVNGSESICGTLMASININTALNSVPVSTALCYQLLPGGAITPFQATYYNNYSLNTGNGSVAFHLLPASGLIKLPAGQYKIGFGIKNKASVTAQISVASVSGFIQIKQ